MVATPDEFMISGSDEARACVCVAKMDKSTFMKYSCALERHSLGMDLSTLLKLLGPFKDSDMVVLCLEDEKAVKIKVGFVSGGI